MPAHASLDALELQVETLQPRYPLHASDPGYPYAWLERTGRSAVMEFQAVVLENEALEVTLVPDLGGRILGIRDKRTGVEILPIPKTLALRDDAMRGVACDQGIRWICGATTRLNDLGPMEFQTHEEDDGSGIASVVMHELVLGTRLDWTATISIHATEPALHVSLSAHNRSTGSEPCVLATLFPTVDVSASNGCAFVPLSHATGIIIQWERGDAEAVDRCDYGTRVVRRTGGLAPRQTDSFSFTMAPIAGISSACAVGDGIALSLTDELRIAVSSLLENGKAFVGLSDGQTLEAPATIAPDKPFVVPLDSFPSELTNVMVRDAHGKVALNWSMDGALVGVDGKLQFSPPVEQLQAEPTLSEPEPELRARLRDAASRHSAAIGLAALALQGPDRNLDDADRWLETALSFDAEDPLTWWLKAVVRRLRGESDDESPELPNAHFLAPMEPALRAEAFLSQPQTHGKEPNPLVKPLANHPDAQAEVACLYLEFGLVEDAARWIDECLRHKEAPGLRYLLAKRLFESTKMAAEASTHVQIAERAAWEPPFPWRHEEVEAIRTLRGAFPDSERLRRLASLLGL